ncbi:MAG: SDR family oxidoreductase [Pseudomonadota bacterium]
MSGRRILVTGAASGIGQALADHMRGRGDEVISVDREEGADILGCDLSNPAAIAAFADGLSRPLDGVAHVAGLPGTHPPETILQVNFCAMRQLTGALGPKLATPATLVAVSSITAHRCTLPEARLADLIDAPDDAILSQAAGMDGTEAYAFSKRLVNIWVEALAARTSDTGLRANAVAPGPVETPILGDFRKSMGREKIAKAAELAGRHGTPSEIATAAAFLLSPEASWVNGVILDCDGGFNAARRVAARSQTETNPHRETA